MQKEKEELHRKIIDLQKELDNKQALELEIQRMRGALEVMEHMKDDEDPAAQERMNEMKEELKEKEDELEIMDGITQALVVKHRRNDDELQGARKELIAVSTVDFCKSYFPWFLFSVFSSKGGTSGANLGPCASNKTIIEQPSHKACMVLTMV